MRERVCAQACAPRRGERKSVRWRLRKGMLGLASLSSRKLECSCSYLGNQERFSFSAGTPFVQSSYHVQLLYGQSTQAVAVPPPSRGLRKKDCFSSQQSKLLLNKTAKRYQSSSGPGRKIRTPTFPLSFFTDRLCRGNFVFFSFH